MLLLGLSWRILKGLLFFIFFFLFCPHHLACGILVPQPGIEPVPPAGKVQHLNHWTTREVPICCCSGAKSCWTLCDLVNRSTQGFPVLSYLLEFAPAQVHRVSDAIQPCQPRSLPSPPALSLSWLQGLFQWVRSLGVPIGSFKMHLECPYSTSPSIKPLNVLWWVWTLCAFSNSHLFLFQAAQHIS